MQKFGIVSLLLTCTAGVSAQTYTRVNDSMVRMVKGNDTVYAEIPGGAHATYLGRLPDPEFPGDINAFIRANIRMPQRNRPLHYGTVRVECTLDNDGKAIKPIIMDTPDTAFNAETIRLISIMPKWKLTSSYRVARIYIPFKPY